MNFVRSDIVGHYIVAYYTVTERADDFDSCWVYFLLDNGHVFSPPIPPWPINDFGWGLLPSKVVRGCHPAILEVLRNNPVTSILIFQSADGQIDEAPLIQLGEDHFLALNPGTPSGLGGGGLGLLRAHEVSLNNARDYWGADRAAFLRWHDDVN